MGQVNQSGIIRAVDAAGASDAYATMIHAMRDIWQAPVEDTRNGPAHVARQVYLRIRNPEDRVILDPVRNANPFFHVMEFVWMMSGSNNVKWIEQFNRRLREYADPGTDTHHGAYGHRWRRWFGHDQLISVRDLLRRDPGTRRAVLSMWDGRSDLANHNDLPCNTHIYFAVVGERLEMTVCNRSNDLIWGMLGANVVHMTLLQELMARSLEREVGPYHVFTNNLHIYKSVPNYDQIWNTFTEYSIPLARQSILAKNEKLEYFLADCEEFITMEYPDPRCSWLSETAAPMYDAYRDKKNRAYHMRHIASEDWRFAAHSWAERKELASKTL